jgi:hypothetical protein
VKKDAQARKVRK